MWRITIQITVTVPKLKKRWQCEALWNFSSARGGKKETCQHCDLSFGNAGALATHIKCKHGTVPVISKPDNAPVQVSTPGPSEESLLENDNQTETTSSTSNATKRKKKEK